MSNFGNSMLSDFMERRDPFSPGLSPTIERRQFGNSYTDLSDDGAELAKAVDQYKLLNRRRYITFDEVLSVIQSLGYRKVEANDAKR